MRALIVDEFEIGRSGFRMALEDNFDDCIICEADTIEEALICLECHGTDLVLLTVGKHLDISDPAVIRLREFATSVPLVLVGDAKSKLLVKESFKNNVRGFLDRSNSKDVMVAAIQLIMAGGQYFPPEAHETQQSRKNKDLDNQEQEYPITPRRLTRRQIQVLRAVAEGKSNKIIGEELGISPGTVKVHISNLMKDLQAKNRTQAVMIANNMHIL